jgi:hypothetical protein
MNSLFHISFHDLRIGRAADLPASEALIQNCGRELAGNKALVHAPRYKKRSLPKHTPLAKQVSLVAQQALTLAVGSQGTIRGPLGPVTAALPSG